MSSISWTLLHVCMRSRHFAAGAGTGGTSGSSSVEQRGGRLSGRTGTCYCTMKNSSTCFNRRVFVLVRVSCIEHKGISQLVRRELKIRVDIDGEAIGVTRSPCPYPRPCVHVCIVLCNNRVSVSSWEKSVIDSLRKAIYFSDHLPKAKGAGSFDPALRDRFFEMTPPIKDIRKRSFTIFRFEYDYFRSI